MDIYTLYDPLVPLTAEVLDKMPAGKIFAKGELIDGPSGINMNDSGRMLRWIAKKGGGNDWAIYCFWARTGLFPTDDEPPHHDETHGFDPHETYWEYIAKNGDKVRDDRNIRNCINASDDAMKLYRY